MGSTPLEYCWFIYKIGARTGRLTGQFETYAQIFGDERARRVGLRVLAGVGAEIDTTTANGRLVFGIFAALAEFETRTDRRAYPCRPSGRPRQRSSGWPPRKMDVAMLRMAMRAIALRDTNAQDLAQHLGITTTTLYMYVNGDGTVKEPGQKLLDALGHQE